MRKILGTFLFFATCVTFALAQRGGPPGGLPGGGGFTFDPNQIFEKWAQGQPNITIANVQSFSRAGLEEYAKQNNITNGQISRSQFTDYWANKEKYRAGGTQGIGKRSPGQMAAPGAPPATPGATPVPGAPPVNPIEAINQAAEAEFRHRDQNGDGVLNFDEMPRSLREQIDRWDLNGDGLISLDEFRQYYAARMQMRGGGIGGPIDDTPAPITIIVEDDLDKRPVVFRAGKLPKELPKWFKELDADRDGQVSFHEWRKGGKDLEEFKEWDRNDDGFITAEEVLSKVRYENLAKANQEAAEGSESSASEEDGGRAMRGKMMRGGGDGPQGMRGGDRGGDRTEGEAASKKGRFGNFGGAGGDTSKKGNFGGFSKKGRKGSDE
jgi:Ca2+-binding EF-hand superfamily protein